jgi:hypothetical protein
MEVVVVVEKKSIGVDEELEVDVRTGLGEYLRVHACLHTSTSGAQVGLQQSCLMRFSSAER